jgi:sugar phosphate isomerase/epimerase
MLGLPGSAIPPGKLKWGICAENFTDAFRSEFRSKILRILDGIELKWTKYDLEPEKICFFYEPEECAQFIDDVGHPDFGLHLDMMNMVSQATIFRTSELIDRTFDLLGDHIHSAHLKDVRWGWEPFAGFVQGTVAVDASVSAEFSPAPYHVFCKLDECLIGDGEVDYRTYLAHLAKKDVDFPCICEHLFDEDEYVTTFNRLHALAEELGTEFIGRTAAQVGR